MTPRRLHPAGFPLNAWFPQNSEAECVPAPPLRSAPRENGVQLFVVRGFRHQIQQMLPAVSQQLVSHQKCLIKIATPMLTRYHLGSAFYAMLAGGAAAGCCNTLTGSFWLSGSVFMQMACSACLISRFIRRLDGAIRTATVQLSHVAAMPTTRNTFPLSSPPATVR